MSSTIAASGAATSTVDDRTTRARIRDAAIETFAAEGIAGTTARKVAARAGVSPGLVIHHFGSMEGLRTACDEHVAAVIREEKRRYIQAGAGLDPLAALREATAGPILAYLANVLTDDSPAVAALVDELVADAQEYIDEGVRSGFLKPTADSRARATVLTMWTLGALVLNTHLDRILGVDLRDPGFADDPATPAYVAAATELLSRGIFTEAFADQVQVALDAAGAGAAPTTDKESIR